MKPIDIFGDPGEIFERATFIENEFSEEEKEAWIKHPLTQAQHLKLKADITRLVQILIKGATDTPEFVRGQIAALEMYLNVEV